MDKKESLKQAFSIKFDINNLMEFHYSTGKFVGLIWIFCGFLFFYWLGIKINVILLGAIVLIPIGIPRIIRGILTRKMRKKDSSNLD
jgi:hypothetical protein